jgi:hypothetical protein
MILRIFTSFSLSKRDIQKKKEKLNIKVRIYVNAC